MAYIADPIDKNDTLYIIPYCEGNRSVTGITNTYKYVYTIFYKLFLHIRELAVICNQLPQTTFSTYPFSNHCISDLVAD
jgi:hypothetical protein